MEYLGYAFLGKGEGLLFFGAGDLEGYADTAHDLIANSLGALLSAIYCYFFKRA